MTGPQLSLLRAAAFSPVPHLTGAQRPVGGRWRVADARALRRAGLVEYDRGGWRATAEGEQIAHREER